MTRIGSLFSGYGGLDAGVRQVLGGTVAWHSDIEPASVRLVEHHYPDVPNLGDITTVDWAAVEPVDVLTAGYPCQPFSAAGLRKGADDERYLWPHVAIAISCLAPRLVVLENVAGHLVRGFADVVGSLASLGYDAQWATVRASDVGAPHRRERLFVVAWPVTDSGGFGRDGWPTVVGGRRTQAVGLQAGDNSGDAGRLAPADPPGIGWDEGRPESAGLVGGPDAPLGCDDPLANPFGGGRLGRASESKREAVDGTAAAGSSEVDWGTYEPAIRRWERLTRPAPSPTEPGRTGQPRLSPRFVEWMQGLPDGHVTAVPGLSRNEQLKLLGNGVVPQQAAAALRHLLAAELVAA